MEDKKEKALNEEKNNLKEIKRIIDKEILKESSIIKNYNKFREDNQINTYQKVDESQYAISLKNKNKLETIKKNLYFGRIDLEYCEDNEIESVYIGKKELILDDKAYIIN